MRILSLLLLICFTSFGVKAEHVLTREKYNLIIASDTVCAGENYELTVDLKENKNAVVYWGNMLLPVFDNKARIKFKAAAYAYDVKGMSKQRQNIRVVIDSRTLSEDVTYFVVKPPMPDNIRRVQDSLTALLFKKQAYENIPDAAYYQEYALGFSCEFGENVLKEEVGQLLVLLVVDSKGKVIKYDIVKNTYKTISLQKIQNAIESYQFENVEHTGNMKLSAVIYTVKGYRGNVIVCSNR